MATLTQQLSAINADIKHLKKVRKDAIARIKELERRKRLLKENYDKEARERFEASAQFSRTARTALMASDLRNSKDAGIGTTPWTDPEDVK